MVIFASLPCSNIVILFIGGFMRLLVAGVNEISGLSKKDKSPFSFARLLILEPVENVSRPGLSIRGHGLRLLEYDCDSSVIDMMIGHKEPVIMEVQTEGRPRNGKIETVVISVKKVT